MPEAITITPELKNSLDALENAHNITNIGACLEDTTHREFGEYVSITSALYNWAGAKHLYENAKVYCDIAAEVIQSHLIQDKGTETEEEWPFTSEFEGIADNACIEFCNSNGYIPLLRKCLNQIRLVFSNVKSVYAELDYFEEDFSDEEGHIAIRLEVTSGSQNISTEYKTWIDWLVCNVDAKDIGLFTLTIRRV